MHVRIEFGLRVGTMALRDAIPLLPELLVLSLEKRRDEIVLGSEVPIETRLRNAGSLDNSSDAVCRMRSRTSSVAILDMITWARESRISTHRSRSIARSRALMRSSIARVPSSTLLGHSWKPLYVREFTTWI